MAFIRQRLLQQSNSHQIEQEIMALELVEAESEDHEEDDNEVFEESN